MRVAWDLQAVTGPGRTGLGVSVQFMLDALESGAPDVEVAGLRPNERDAALGGVGDRLAWEQWRLPAELRATHAARPLDLAYSPALGAPLFSPVPGTVAHARAVEHGMVRDGDDPLLQNNTLRTVDWFGDYPGGYRDFRRRITLENEKLARQYTPPHRR